MSKYGFYNPEIGRKGGRIGGKAVQKTLKERKLGLYNPANFGKGIEVLRKNLHYIWSGVKFLSKQEMECAKIMLSQPIENLNCHIKINSKTIDFYPQSNDKMLQNCFVEYHPLIKFLRPNETAESYYAERRKILDNNGYADKKLVVIHSLKEINKMVEAFEKE